MENNNNKELEEWLQLVHEGSCCACVDPMKEEKQEFLESLSDKNKSKPTGKEKN